MGGSPERQVRSASVRSQQKVEIAKDKLTDDNFDQIVMETLERITTNSCGQEEDQQNAAGVDDLDDDSNEKSGKPSSYEHQQHPHQQQGAIQALSQPKRPMNAFMVWGRAIRRELHTKYSNVQNAMLSKALGRVWRRLDSNQKEPYISKANAIKANHKRDYPDYRYQPRRLQEKLTRKQQQQLRQQQQDYLEACGHPMFDTPTTLLLVRPTCSPAANGATTNRIAYGNRGTDGGLSTSVTGSGEFNLEQATSVVLVAAAASVVADSPDGINATQTYERLGEYDYRSPQRLGEDGKENERKDAEEEGQGEEETNQGQEDVGDEEAESPGSGYNEFQSTSDHYQPNNFVHEPTLAIDTHHQQQQQPHQQQQRNMEPNFNNELAADQNVPHHLHYQYPGQLNQQHQYQQQHQVIIGSSCDIYNSVNLIDTSDSLQYLHSYKDQPQQQQEQQPQPQPQPQQQHVAAGDRLNYSNYCGQNYYYQHCNNAAESVQYNETDYHYHYRPINELTH